MKETVNEGLKITPTVARTPETGIDTDKTLISNMLDAAVSGGLDLGSINNLVQSAQNREQSYELIDAMSQDDVISAVLETYAEDTVQTNDKGQSVWIESDNADILDYTTWLLDSLNIDKHMYQWAYCLVTYGDVYVRLFRESDEEEDLLFKNIKNKNKTGKLLNENVLSKEAYDKLNEDVTLKIYKESDKYIPYVQMIDNPGEMFDLQKFGKTHGYIKAPVRMVQQINDDMYNYITHYKMNQNDVEIYDGTSFVHGCLENTNQRQPETVDIFLDSYIDNQQTNDNQIAEGITENSKLKTSYSVKRGQSILYNSFRVWRELNLLELSALMNRLTKSSIVRVLNVDVGDMPKEQIQNFMSRLKEKIEQKNAVDTNKSMQNYNAAGPIDNTIYVPTHGTQGQITTSTIGGDFDPKTLVDLEYFRDKLFGALKVPKQFFGQTGDSTGFNGGSSLTIVSSRYGKTIKRLQSVLCQLVTDIINLFLIDRGMDNYVNKFQVRMQTPVTQEEIDKRTNTDNRIRFVGDVMNQLNDVDDKATKLKIYKALLTTAVNDSDIISYLNSYIESLEEMENKKDKRSKTSKEENSIEEPSTSSEESAESTLPTLGDIQQTVEEFNDSNTGIILTETPEEKNDSTTTLNEIKEDEVDKTSYLPTAEELGIDCTTKL